MPVPAFNAYGVLPTGRHDCTLGEMETAYAINRHREKLWGDFQSFLAWADVQPKPSSILVDGSFTTDKVLPKDIDVVFDLDGCDDASRNHWIFVFGSQRNIIADRFRVDFWVYFPGFSNDLRLFFEYVRPEEAILRGMQVGDRKGLLRIVL